MIRVKARRKGANHVMSGGGAGKGDCNCKGSEAGLGLWCLRNGEASDVAEVEEAVRTEVGHEVSEVLGPRPHEDLTVVERPWAFILGKSAHQPHREAS